MVYINFGKRDKKTAPRRFLGHPEAVFAPLAAVMGEAARGKGIRAGLTALDFLFHSAFAEVGAYSAAVSVKLSAPG